jgi:hypothetical protein
LRKQHDVTPCGDRTPEVGAWHVGRIDDAQRNGLRFEIIAQSTYLVLMAKIDHPSPDFFGFRESAQVTVKAIIKWVIRGKERVVWVLWRNMKVPKTGGPRVPHLRIPERPGLGTGESLSVFASKLPGSLSPNILGCVQA